MKNSFNKSPLERAIAVWDMKDGTGRDQFPYTLEPLGKVSFIELEGEAKAASVLRGSDGYAAYFEDGCLMLNKFVSRIIRPKEKYSLYIRTCLNGDSYTQSRTLFCTDHLILTQHPTGLMTLFLSQEVPTGKVFREIPLGYVAQNGWLDFILTIGDDKIQFYSQGKLINEIPLLWKICAAFVDELVIGAFKSNKPDTCCFTLPMMNFKGNYIDTVAIWHETLTMDEIAHLSGVEKIEVILPQDRLSRACRIYSEYFDASVRHDVAGCEDASQRLMKLADEDDTRPRYHLTQPMGLLFDPAGAFFHEGKYHVFSYHNINFLLEYSSLDHYVSDDLLHWRQWPMLHADSEHDFFCIYLMNHFRDENGQIRILYTGQGMEGKRGIMAQSDDGLVSYTNKYPAICKYHHDGHVFQHGERWYTITSRMCRQKRPNGLGDAVMLWSSKDLINWEEEGEIFCRMLGKGNEGLSKDSGFMEFPYLLSFGEKDVLILGGWPVDYWVGRFDWDNLKFIPDEEDGKLLDQINHFHCFNPLCVDQDAEGRERRILMALYSSVGSGRADYLPWSCTHVLPRKLSLEENYLRQDPVEELKKLRGENDTFHEIQLNPEKILQINKNTSSLEILAQVEAGILDNIEETARLVISLEFDCVACEKKNKAIVSYYPKHGTFSLEGDVHNTGIATSYLKDPKKPEIRIFADRRMLEIFVNGQSMSTALLDDVQDHCRILVFAEGMDIACHKLDVWEMKLEK